MKRLCQLLLAACCAAATGALEAERVDRAWRVADLAAADGDVAALGGENNRVLGKVSTQAMRVLYAVERAIEAAAELEAELVIVEGRVPNAFAGTGGKGENVIGINFAMLDLIEDDTHAAAAVIGHEIAHLKLDHGEKSARTRAGTGVLGVIGGVVLGSMGVPAAQSLSSLTVSAVQSGYSRENEREADYLGAIWAVEAGFDPYGAVRLHEALGRVPGAARGAFFSTHPSSPERIATLKALAARLTPDGATRPRRD